MELYCRKCVELLPTMSFKLQDCDCLITDYDYYATKSMDNCPCDEMCDNCVNISYSQHKVSSELISITCKRCGIVDRSCCDGGYYKLKND